MGTGERGSGRARKDLKWGKEESARRISGVTEGVIVLGSLSERQAH